MKSILLIITLIVGFYSPTQAQTTSEKTVLVPVWTEADRKFLLDNLTRTKEELISETKNLTKQQWNFKESPDRWSINQIVEHLALWELIFTRENSVALQNEGIPGFAHYLPDSLFLQPKEMKPNNALDATKPFSFAMPLGNNEGKNNVTWLITMHNESIEYLKTETKNIRVHYICFGPNVHQNFMMVFGHTDRHLHQIRKVKAHPKYPK